MGQRSPDLVTRPTFPEAVAGAELSGQAVYVCAGRAWGFRNGQWMDVHGARAQRSDPRSGDPADDPLGFGPQGDELRILDDVRCVR